jgi:hypothetical protein
MNGRRLMKIFTGIICLFSLFVLPYCAGAWTWKGFSGLCVSGELRGKEGETIEFRLYDVTLYTQCYNINTDQGSQPGIGNAGSLTLTTETEGNPSKVTGIVSVSGCIYLDIFDDHDHPDHIHTCQPLDNKNKIELLGSAWISDFVADWVWYDAKGKEINRGTDTCVWPGEIVDGYPEHGVEFECTSTSEKKINWVLN